MKNAERGFTLIEVMTVLVILSVLLGVSIPKYQEVRKKAVAAWLLGSVMAVRNAAFQYNEATGAWPPATAAGRIPRGLAPYLPSGFTFTGTDPEAADNRALREACEQRIPIMYFLGIAPGRYQVMMPAFIASWDGPGLKTQVAFGQPDVGLLGAPTNEAERRYALRVVQQRLHQASFRQAVLSAYGGRCAVSGLPEAMLLDAAHIVADADEKLGQPIIANGLALSKLHHAALDAHLIGIDPDFRIHVSEKLLVQRDGPMLEALKGLRGAKLLLPNRAKDHPDRDRLAVRFERFRVAA